MAEPMTRRQFLNVASLFEGGLAAVAFALGWLVGVDPLEMLHADWRALGWGLLATVPMFGLFCISMYRPAGGLRTIRSFLLEYLGPLLAACRWHDLLAVAMIAGIGEELLFRGLLQPWIAKLTGSFAIGLVGSNIAFGLAHFITPTYAVLAFVMGLLFGSLPLATDPPNILAPIVTHAVYDWLAFMMVAQVYRREKNAGSSSERADASE
jgi:membrane protease YdiL (CAAX protease family)